MNNELIKKAKSIAVSFPELLIPNKNVDLLKWSVIACDQYTSQPDYWKSVEEFVEFSPSTLNITLPEIYLEKPGENEKIEKINHNMSKYLEDNVLQKLAPGVVYIERKIKNGKSRKGVVLSVDLERYDFSVGSRSLIRATEKTVSERIPPRIKVRNNASIETPHILILIDDPKHTVIEPIANTKEKMTKIYDFDLMKNGGKITGYYTNDENLLNNMVDALIDLAEPNTYKNKYNMNDMDNLMIFAMGDGNHSLATAKTHWENVKKTLSPDQLEVHPARYALIELLNLHDSALEFEAIHRVIFDVNTTNLLDEFVKLLPGSYYKMFDSEYDFDKFNKNSDKERHSIPFVTNQKYGLLFLNNPNETLTVAAFESTFNSIPKELQGHSIDYIHGDDTVKELTNTNNNIGFFLPSMDKDELFKYVLIKGSLPKKTFSMGEADEKRFYLECRKIVM